MRLCDAALGLLLLAAPPAHAQLLDDFSDGDLSRAPAWSGDLDAWTTALLDGDPALRTDGAPQRDTLYLATASAVSYGRWAFTFAYRGVNLSSFNGARVYLTADTTALLGDVHGYYLQLGTTNADHVRLVRQDGASDQRVELGRSLLPLVAGDSGTVRLEVTRSGDDDWTVLADGVPALHARDGTYTSARAFGVWLKHTPASARAFYFDDVAVNGTSAPPDDGTAPAPHDLVINEVQYAPPDPALEFVELYNRADRAFDLRRLTLSDDHGTPVPITDTPTPLPPGGYAVLVRDAGAFAATYPGVPFVAVAPWPSLNDGGDVPTLRHRGTVIDAVPYAPSWGRPGASLERLDPAGPSDHPSNFGGSTALPQATPGAVNSRYAPDVAPPRLLFVDQPPDEAGGTTLAAFFDEPLDLEELTPDALTVGGRPAAALTARADTLLFATFDGALSGDALTVRDVPDLTGNRLVEATHPIAYPPAPGELLLNEIMFAPRADAHDHRPDQPEYVELYNHSARLLSLRGLYWTDAPDEHGRADTTRIPPHPGGAPAALRPGGFAVVFSLPAVLTRDEGPTFLRLVFAGLPPDAPGLALLPLDRTTLGLANDGDAVRLHRADGEPLEAVGYAPSWHHPALADATGVALERIDAGAPAGRADNWTSSTDDSGGTPGRPNGSAVEPGEDAPRAGFTIAPSPFSPDRDGHDDVAVLRYTLRSDVALARVRIYDSRGRPVRMLSEAHLAGRTGSLRWDGLGDGGRMLPTGLYVVLFEAFDARGGRAEAYKAVVVLARPLR